MTNWMIASTVSGRADRPKRCRASAADNSSIRRSVPIASPTNST
jgi:hypothetical protein